MEITTLLHKPARLHIPANDKRWHIIFYVYDVPSGQTKRKRFYELPPGDTREERIYKANQVCQYLNQQLAKGIVSDKYEYTKNQIIEENTDNPVISKLSVSAALMRVYSAKRFIELRTSQSYGSIADSFCSYIEKLKPEPNIEQFNIEYAQGYLDKLLSDGKAPRTHNNHLLTLRTMWNEGIDQKFFTYNPWKSIPKIKTPIGKNIAYLPAQQREILDYAKKYPEMEFLIKFMYYTLARTNEIGHLQVKHIGMYTPNKIYLPATVSKNNIERHIVIPPGLEDEFKKFNIRSLPPHWYIFGNDKFKTGPERMVTKKIGSKYREWILNKLKYPMTYTLYSWKHTGVIAAHKAGVTDDDIMMQTGHKDYGSFQKYLKSLSLYDHQNFADKIPRI